MNAKTRVHGMDGSLVEPDWPPLETAEVRALLAEYPRLAGGAEILSASPRPFSAASVVRAGRERVFVKRHARSVRDREGLLEEHGFLSHLLAQGAPVPRVLATSAGETAVERGEWTYEVHAIPAGIDLYEEAVSWTPFRSLPHARSAGALLGQLHEAARGYGAPARKVQPLVTSFSIFSSNDPWNAFREYCTARAGLHGDDEVRQRGERALELLEPFHAELKPLLPALAPLWTHNDLHASNLFWSGSSKTSKAVAAIDFGLADRTNAVHDLAQTIERNMVEWLTLVNDPSHPENVAVDTAGLDALLAGYTSVRSLSEAEAAALAPMLALCHVEFALTEADYFLGVLHSREKARTATDGYLVGHAEWFLSAAGQRMLDRIRAWATTRTGEAHAR